MKTEQKNYYSRRKTRKENLKSKVVAYSVIAILTIIAIMYISITMIKSQNDLEKQLLEEEGTWFNNEPNSYSNFLNLEIEETLEDDYSPKWVKKLKDEKKQKFINNINNKIINFFDGYGVDMRDSLSELKDIYIYSADDEILEEGISGYIYSGTKDIYIREDIITNLNSLQSTYVHEVIHYLGAMDAEVMNLTEGLTDCIAEWIVGEDYEIADGYLYERQVAQMLLIANPDWVSVIFNGSIGENTRIQDEINNRLKEFEVNCFDGIPYKEPAKILDDSIKLLYQAASEEHFALANIQLQEIVIAYCNACEVSSEDIRKEKNLFLFPYDLYYIDQEMEEIITF